MNSLWRLRDLSFDRRMSSRRFKVALRPRLSGITEHPKMDFVDYERRLTSLQAVLQPQLARAHVGQKVAFERDNCPADLGGTISFIAP